MNFQPRIFKPTRILEAAQAFVAIEASSGLVLLLAAAVGLLWINSPWGDSYTELWHTHFELRAGSYLLEEDLRDLVNDGVMTLFFFLMGLEIKREIVHGELSSVRHALLPAVAALGGMLTPALIYLAFNSGGAGASGWGVPMATDIAFSLGVLSLLGSRVPFGAKVFLLTLAIADDIGAVIVIAIFYSSSIDFAALAVALGLLAVVVMVARAGLRDVKVYIVMGVLLWLALYESGAHATLAGVILGLLCPAVSYYSPQDYPRTAARLLGDFQHSLITGNTDEQQGLLSQTEDLSSGTEAPLERLGRALHPWVSFGVMPCFALANAGVSIDAASLRDAASSSVVHGVVLGLLLGKPAGIFLFSWLAVRLGLCELPTGATWRHIFGVGVLGGVGFTVALLVSTLAYEDIQFVEQAKLGILAASLCAGLLGYMSFRFRRTSPPETRDVSTP